MEMEVRCFLSAIDAIVLERKYSEGPISLDERLCDSFSRGHYSPALLVGKIEQRRDMPTRDNAALAHFELPRINHGQGMFAFVYDLPPFFATRHTKVARISYGKFDHLPSPINLVSDELFLSDPTKIRNYFDARSAFCSSSVNATLLRR